MQLDTRFGGPDFGGKPRDFYMIVGKRQVSADSRASLSLELSVARGPCICSGRGPEEMFFQASFASHCTLQLIISNLEKM